MRPRVELVTSSPSVKRRTRSPKHTFTLRQRPFQIQPFMIAPVLPGETMKNALMQMRAYSDPVASRMVGWWMESYLFYVKLRDLDDRDAITAIFSDPTADLSSLAAASDLKTYHHGGTINWTRRCLDRVVKEYFRDEDDAGTYEIDGVPVAQATLDRGFLDSAKLETSGATEQDEQELPGVDPTIPDGVAAGFENHFAQWERMRALKHTDLDFGDFLRSYGITPPRELRKAEEELHKPELLRFVRDWTYPSNTIADDGSASSAAVWSIAERADKDRFFQEPGFVFGCTVARPKVYLGAVNGAGAGLMNNAFTWMPAVLQGESYTGLREIAAGEGFFDNADAVDVWIDLADLFNHGDQFANFDITAAGDAAAIALPKADPADWFPDATMADAFFTNASANEVHLDGICSLNIATRAVSTDTTPTS